ncbi:MAG: carboxyl transferase domain-containing protein [Planctomycetota bacterium]|nr:carboxyl transferase domain-containing protein [Planctomycetota bacterium]
MLAEAELIRVGTGEKGRARQQKLGRLTARDRIAELIDPGTELMELNLWAAHRMYDRWGDVPAAGVVTGIGHVHSLPCMIVANDATVKAGAFFPQTVKKVIRAQNIAFRCNIPLLYLVDSAGVFLPLQDEIFPDDDDFGRIFRNNAVLSAAGLPQYAAILGNCVAGGAYLPVLCDKILMTEGSALYLAGPSLVKAAIGQVVDEEELGGALMHSEVSGTVDFFEPDDPSALKRTRALVEALPAEKYAKPDSESGVAPRRDAQDLYDLVSPDGRKEYDARDVLECIVDANSMLEYKEYYGQSLVTCYAKIDGRSIGIVANQRKRTKAAKGGIQIGGVVYAESADKAARFVMDCNQTGIPIVFIQDVTGFMVGRDAEQSGIIRSGAKLVNAISNSRVPRITVIVGGAYGAGTYAMCGKAFDPHFVFAWPSARYAVMGGAQAAKTLVALEKRQAERSGEKLSEESLQELQKRVTDNYDNQTDIRYGAARGWVDSIIAPHETRQTLIEALSCATRTPPEASFYGGVMQV